MKKKLSIHTHTHTHTHMFVHLENELRDVNVCSASCSGQGIEQVVVQK